MHNYASVTYINDSDKRKLSINKKNDEFLNDSENYNEKWG